MRATAKRPRVINQESYRAGKRLVKELEDYGTAGETFHDHREKDGWHHETVFIIGKAMERFAERYHKRRMSI
jgi:hypothetical protein